MKDSFICTVRHNKEAPGKIVITHTCTIIDQTSAIYAKASIVKINNFV